MASDVSSAMTTRSLRMVRTELEFLADSSVITRQLLNSILSQLPEESAARSVSRSQQATPAQPSPTPLPEPVQAQPPPAPYSPPVSQMHNASLNEKAPNQYVAPPPQMPPPAYPQVPPVLSLATALYAYQPTDAGDLALAPNDRIQVIEHMNDDWWRGRNERTGMEGIFPRSYVNVSEKGPMPPQPTNYGNMPLEVSQGGGGPSNPQSNEPSKFEQGGKKFGKKLGNAAIFGAGATAGSNLVNAIF